MLNKKCECSKVLLVDDSEFNLYTLGKFVSTFEVKFDKTYNGE